MNQPVQPDPPIESLSRVQVLAALGITAIILLVIIRVWQFVGAPVMFPLGWSWGHLLMGVALGALITAGSGLIYRLWPAYRASSDRYLTMILRALTWPDLIWLGLLPGTSEEMLFRGLLLPAFGIGWLGLGLSSLCFGAMHFSGSQQWPYVVWASVIGAALGGSAIATGSLMVPLAAHVTTNILSGSLWKLANGTSG
ncbi:MAG: lysostaphin resistance A-like protein [Elainellaceae cyanobacterium]